MPEGQLDLLIFEQLVEPFDRTASLLTEILEELNAGESGRAASAGLFALAVSQVEAAFSDTLLYVLTRNPWRMEFEELQVKRADVLSAEFAREILEIHAEELVRKWSYGSKELLFKRFQKVLALPESMLADKNMGFTRLRERRNAILHQRLRDGDKSGSSGTWVSPEEASGCVSQCLAFATDVSAAIRERYSSHTRVAALRRLWSHLFESPIMQFDDYWIIDEEEDRVVATKADAPVGSLAKSERMILGLWRAEFNGDASLLADFHMKHLTPRRQRDLVTLIAALRDIWVY